MSSTSIAGRRTRPVVHPADEQANFLNYNNVTTSSVTNYNHTPEAGATTSVVLNGAENKQVGLAMSLKVVPGDTIDMEVFAKYYVPSNPGVTPGTAIASAMASAFGLSPGGQGPEYAAYQAVSAMFSSGWFLAANDWEDENAPKAFLNYILFDEDFIPYDMGWDQISTDAGMTQTNPNPPHDRLSLQAVVEKGGLCVYLLLQRRNCGYCGSVLG